MDRGKILPPIGDGFGVMPGRMVQTCGLSPTARTLYCVIWYHRVKSQEFPSIEELTDQIGVKNKSTVISAILELEVSKWLKVIRTAGRPHDYQLLDGTGTTVDVTPAVHEARATERKKKAAKPERQQDPLTKSVGDFWMKAHLEKWGKPYRYEGEKDWTAVQGLIKFFRDAAAKDPLVGDADVLAGLRGAVDQVWADFKVKADPFLGPNSRTISGFFLCLNKLPFQIRIGFAKPVGKTVCEDDLGVNFVLATPDQLRAAYEEAVKKGLGEFFIKTAKNRGRQGDFDERIAS